MNLFAFFVRLNHRQSESDWGMANAVFTGKVERVNDRTKIKYREVTYNTYEIRYNVDGKEYHGFKSFYPLEDPDIEEIKDTVIKIKYNTKRPWRFESVFDNYEVE